MQQKIQHIAQSLEARSSEHISSDQVEQLEKQVEQLSADFAWVQQFLKELQENIGHVVQSAPET